MNITRRSFLAGAAGLVSALGSLDLLTAAQAAGESASAGPLIPVSLPPLKLRGYGTLSAMFRPLHNGASSLTHITCESPMKAHLVQAKYLSDLTRLPGTHEDTLTVGGHSLPIHRSGSGGAVACYARGNDVLILAAVSPSQLKEICEALAPHSLTAADFTAQTQVPMWLDRWDKYGLLIYYGPYEVPPTVPWPGNDYDFTGDLNFVRDNGTGFVLWDTPGSELSWGWVQEAAATMGIPVHLNTSYSWPMLRFSNHFRDETQLKMPQFMGGFYDIGWLSGTQGAISWNSQAGEDALLSIFQQGVRRFAGDPNIVGWLEPHAESSQTPSAQFCEYGPVADESLRRFLQERYGSLATVSKRWHGHPDFYKSWSDVHAPEMAEFAGFGPDAIDLRGTWRIKYTDAAAPVPPAWYGAGFDDSGWDEFVAPGNDRMIRMPRAPLCYRRTVTVPAEWLDSQPQVTLYIWDLASGWDDLPTLYINGTKITGHSNGGPRWAYYDVTKALKAGANLIAFSEVHGIICYRTYLTTVPPGQYPDLGPQKNAQWVDYNAWTLWSRQAQMRRGVEMIRQVDPNRSINFMAPNDDPGTITELCKEYGCVFHDTGGMAGNWGDFNTLAMRGAGLPATAEPGGGADNLESFHAYWGRWITEGLNGIHYFQRLGEIIWRPEILADFEKNRRMYEAIGKYHVPFAETAMLYSTRNARLTYFPWDAGHTIQWQPGGYQSGWNMTQVVLNYCPRDIVSEEALGAGMVSQYRVIVDSNTTFVNEEVLARIENYVRAGGVFVTYGETGRHLEVEPNTWPISRLTGYQVVDTNVYGKGLMASPAPGQTVFSGPIWEAKPAGFMQSLKKVAADSRDLLLWSNGTVAAGMRPMGKGWIVHLGGAFKQEQQAAMLQQLLSHFGATERVPAQVTPQQQDLRFLHAIGNSGLQDIWILFNDTNKAVTADLTFLPGVHPASLADIVTGADIPIIRDASGDAVKGIALAPRQTVMYVSPRADAAGSPLEWLRLQRGWWQGTQKPSAKPLPAPNDPFSVDMRHDWAYKSFGELTDAQSAAMADPAFDDHAWERRSLDVWRTPGDVKHKHVMLRRKFTVPAHWDAGTTIFQNGNEVLGARTYLDGKVLYDGQMLRDGPALDNLDDILKPGTTHLLALEIENRLELIGVSGAPSVQHIPEPQARQDLAGEWVTYANAWHKSGTLTLPGHSTKAEFLSRAVTIDREHAGRNVVVYVRTAAGPPSGVITNGKRIDGQGKPMLINVTPFINFGQENTIELVMNGNQEDITIAVVELRYYDKGFYP